MDIYDPIAEALGVSTIDFIPDYSEYGVSYVGVPGVNKGIPHTEETKRKISLGKKGIPVPALQGRPTWNKGIQAHNKGKPGKPMSEEHKAIISAAQKGKPKSAEHRAKISAAVSAALARKKTISCSSAS